MKKYFGLQKVILALTTLTLVGLSSCNDQNFDWDEAHATQQYEKFTNVFIKEFGKPAEGHQWGFDYAQIALNGGSSSSTPSTRATKKWDEVNSPGNIGVYGTPDPITKREHEEVYNWFTNHIVTWKKNPSYVSEIGVGTDRSIVQQTAFVINKNYSEAGYGSLIEGANFTFNNNNGVLGDYNVGTTNISFSNGWVQTVAQNPNKEPIYYSSLEGKVVYKRKNGGKYLYIGNYCEADATGNKITNGSTTEAANVYFYKVLNGTLPLFKSADNKIFVEGNGNYQPYQNGLQWVDQNYPILSNKEELILDSYSDVKIGHMDYFNYWDEVTQKYEHTKDWNGATNYGWGTTFPGTLITDANVNDWTYGSSASRSSYHDKYFMVYLKGADYEGWYIGLDFEAQCDNSNDNERQLADGICNDWIIKVSTAGKSIYSNARIMCEDLGGNYGNSTTDIDYNDIVLDVTNKIEDWGNKETVTLTLQAAGGTLPLIVTYKDGDGAQERILFETHEMFCKDYDWIDKLFAGGVFDYELSSVEYETMYNTQENTAPAPTRTFVLYRANETIIKRHMVRIYQPFNIMNIGVKVYRHGLDDYMFNPHNSSEPSSADWISLDNQYGEAPLMICVPSTVKWLKERHKIDDGYPDFREWVRSPSYEFWNNKVNNTHLCE